MTLPSRTMTQPTIGFGLTSSGRARASSSARRMKVVPRAAIVQQKSRRLLAGFRCRSLWNLRNVDEAIAGDAAPPRPEDVT